MKGLWELIKSSVKEKCFDLFWNSLNSYVYMEISLENLIIYWYVDIEA